MAHPLRPLLSSVVLAALAACGPEATTAPTAPVSTGTSTVEAPSAPPDAPDAASGSAAAPDASKDERTLFVHEKRVDCEGEGPRKCLQVRESESADWTLFYSSIEGFKHEEGTRYVLRVSVEKVARPMADASSLKYKLIEIVSQKKMPNGP